MKETLFTIGPFTAHGYGFMIAIGVIFAYLVAEYRAKKIKLNAEPIFALTICCLIGGILSARILYYLTQIKEIIQDPSLLFHFSDGFVIYGGIIGGILTGYLFCKIKKLNFLNYFDLVMPSIAFAQGFGRIGCFLAGCCYGRQTDSFIGIAFHNSNIAPNGIPLIPTQLISSGLDFLNFFALILFAKTKKAEGQVAGLYLIFYSIGRFILEFFRGDLERGSIGQLSTSQFISIFILFTGIAIFVICGRQNKSKNIFSS